MLKTVSIISVFALLAETLLFRKRVIINGTILHINAEMNLVRLNTTKTI